MDDADKAITDDMIEAGVMAYVKARPDIQSDEEIVVAIFRAMISASNQEG